jgi:hypothetical protein
MAVVEVHPVPIDGPWIERFVLDRHVISSRRSAIPGRQVPFKILGCFARQVQGHRDTLVFAVVSRRRVRVWMIAATESRAVRGEHARWSRRPSISWWTT